MALRYIESQARLDHFNLPIEETTLAQTQNVCGGHNQLLI